jgi:hypothetical protein
MNPRAPLTPNETSAGPSRASPARALVAVYAIAVLLGAGLGSRGLAPFAEHVRQSSSTPLARVGLALGEARPELDAEDWRLLDADVATARASYSGEKEAFDLVVALRGLASHGEVDWAGAERSCRALHWPRCDRPALEELRVRSRP